MSCSSESPRGSDIVKQGYLYIKRPPRHGFLKLKTWHKRYFVLRDETSEHSRRLEMFLRESDFDKGGARKLVLELENVVHVGRTADSKRFKQAFIIVCMGRSAVLLADEDSLSLNSWLLAVTLISGKGRSANNTNGQTYRPLARRRSGELPDCLEGVPLNQYYSELKLEDSNSYEITIQPTEASIRNDLRDDYHLTVNTCGVSLTPIGKEEVAIHWPLCFIRKYKNELLGLSPKRKTTLVTIELGRRCATGEGVFKFRTQNGREIVTDLTQVIAASMSRKVTSDGTNQCRVTCPMPGRGPWCSEDEIQSPTDRPPSLLSSDSHLSENQNKNAMLRSNSAKFNHVRESITTSSATSTSSNESAEYIMASFSENTHRLNFDTSSGLRVCRSVNDLCAHQMDSLTREEVTKQRAARAEAEGYLEVLPDYFEGERESEERDNVYHNMDFTSEDSNKQSSKPPAPLPRPEHTIISGRKSWTPISPTPILTCTVNAQTRRTSPPKVEWTTPLALFNPSIPRVSTERRSQTQSGIEETSAEVSSLKDCVVIGESTSVS